MTHSHQHAHHAASGVAHAMAAHLATRVASHPHLRLGRRKRDPNRRFPHMRDIMAESGFKLPAEPVTFDYTKGFPADSNVLANDRVGCCTGSAKGHRLQAIEVLLAQPLTDPDILTKLVLQFYAESTGYDPSQTQPDGSNPTDQGGDMQVIAKFLLDTGFPMPDGSRDKFVACFELDPKDVAALAYAGNLCVGVDFGIIVTDTVMPADGSAPPAIWTVKPGEQQLGGPACRTATGLSTAGGCRCSRGRRRSAPPTSRKRSPTSRPTRSPTARRCWASTWPSGRRRWPATAFPSTPDHPPARLPRIAVRGRQALLPS